MRTEKPKTLITIFAAKLQELQSIRLILQAVVTHEPAATILEQAGAFRNTSSL